MTVNLFAVPVFFICFRESIETGIIVSVLLSFLKQTLGAEGDVVTHKRLVKKIWTGVAVGMAICLCVGAGMIGAFYALGQDHFANTEDIWEGVFSLLASVIISIMGAALLRVSKLQEKWRVKLAQSLEARDQTKLTRMNRFKRWSEKHAMFILPFVTVLREGLEAVVFIGGVSLSFPASSFPLAVLAGLFAGVCVSYLLYRGGNTASLQMFLVASTCALYLVAAGLCSRGVWYFENNTWNHHVSGDLSETGSGPGSYNIRQSVWHVNCCSPTLNGGGGWGIFNAILGWTNSATYGSVLSYNLYWIGVSLTFLFMRYKERHGRLPTLRSILHPWSDHNETRRTQKSLADTASVPTSNEAIEIFPPKNVVGNGDPHLVTTV